MARGGVNSLLKNSTNSLEQEVSKQQSEAFCSSSKGVFASHLSNNSSCYDHYAHKSYVTTYTRELPKVSIQVSKLL